MSGHLLQTVNPEAVDPIPPDDLPMQCDMVTYITRPGEGRRGRNEFPAMVLNRNDLRGRTGLDLLVIYDAQDVIFRDSVQILSEQNDNSCWKPRPGGEVEMRKELRAIREENAALRRAVFGDWNEPEGGLMEYLVDFEKRIKAVDAAVAKLTKAPAASKAKAKA